MTKTTAAGDPRTRRESVECGFSLAEVVVALGLLAGVLISMAGLLVLGNRLVGAGRGSTAALAEADGQLLREILEAAAAGMHALDAKMDAMLAGQDPRYTPEFIRFLDAEIARLRGGFGTPHLRPRAVVVIYM